MRMEHANNGDIGIYTPKEFRALLETAEPGRQLATRRLGGAVRVMGCPQTPTQIWIRWPGGKTTAGEVSVGAREITVDTEGKVTVNR
jgi:hypothetical protein